MLHVTNKCSTHLHGLQKRLRQQARTTAQQEYTVTRLKDILKQNNISTSGVKAQLVERYADTAVRGGLPLCPNCRAHDSKLMYIGRGYYACKGSYDDRRKSVHSCGFASEKIQRPPFREL